MQSELLEAEGVDEMGKSVAVELAELQTQVKRMVADIESEKGTRSRANLDFEKRIRKLEHVVWAASGFTIGMQIIISIVIALYK